VQAPLYANGFGNHAGVGVSDSFQNTAESFNTGVQYTGITVQNSGISPTGQNMPPFAVVRAWIKY
jgi:hypothetical protein